MTVEFNLFGGTVLKLGTERHRKYLQGIDDNLSVIGCFALTELGYGNNAIEMETTAHWDDQRKEFIINSPSTISRASATAQRCYLPSRYREILDNKCQSS